MHVEAKVSASWLRAARARFESCFDGHASPWIYDALRIGLALVFLVRQADWLRPWLPLEHHKSVHGLLFYESAPMGPALRSPWLVGAALSTTVTRALIVLRTALSFTLLLGVRARLSAALLGGVSLALVAADRYRYFHHLFLLYVALLWLSLAPIGERFTWSQALAWARRHFGGADVEPLRVNPPAAWPLQLLRALTLSVYAAAGFSKLNASWLRGDALRDLELVRLLDGRAWELLRNLLGYSGIAWLACTFELAVCLLLCIPITRRAAVLAAMGFHAGISACMPVFSFGAQMSVLLLSFLSERKLPKRP